MERDQKVTTAWHAIFLAQLVFSVTCAFANLFMNVYLWNRAGAYWHIGVFNLFSVQSIFLSSLCGAYALKKWGTRSAFIISSLLALGLFSYLFVSDLSRPSAIPVLGALYGSYIGLFYIGFNLFMLRLSNVKNRSLLVGLESALATMAQLLTPVAAGYLIAARGYRSAFLIIICLLCSQLVLSARTPKMTILGNFSKRNFFLAENETMARLGFSSAAYGFLYAFIQMSYGLFFYFFTRDELSLGWWNLLFGAVSSVMFWLVGKWLNQSNREIVLRMGMISATIVSLGLFVPVPELFILFNLVISVSLPLLWIPTKTTHYEQMARLARETSGTDDHLLGKMTQLLVFREFSISLGRIAFFLFIVIGFEFGFSVSYYAIVLLAGAMPVVIRTMAVRR